MKVREQKSTAPYRPSDTRMKVSIFSVLTYTRKTSTVYSQ